MTQIATLFPGQGSQYPGMADPWAGHPAGKDALERCSAILGWDVVEKSRDAEALKRTDVVQLAVFACDLAAFDVLKAEGVMTNVAAGHSLGEYVALVASGAVVLEPGLAALAARASAMEKASKDNPGAMTAIIGMSLDEAREVCGIAGRGDMLAVANENSPKQTVLSGSVSAVERAEELARSRGAKAVRLPVAGAFHSPLMGSAVQPVREALSRIHFERPAFPIIPNASGKPTTQPLVLRDLLSRHLISPVRWDASMQAIAGMGVDFVIEAGPGDVLGKLARRAVPGATVRSVGTPEQARAVADEVRSHAPAPTTEEAR
ncbi:MAG TPA: ACP S-malonyltransferase [Actinomycetota bacterium]|nr:ACP S-malonyltransferase [Actinomycetota bacterium]